MLLHARAAPRRTNHLSGSPMNPENVYPQPQLRRSGCSTLDGTWQFSLDPDASWLLPEHVQWNAAIVVLFSPETPASGIRETGHSRACWYRRSFYSPPPAPGEGLLL